MLDLEQVVQSLEACKFNILNYQTNSSLNNVMPTMIEKTVNHWLNEKIKEQLSIELNNEKSIFKFIEKNINSIIIQLKFYHTDLLANFDFTASIKILFNFMDSIIYSIEYLNLNNLLKENFNQLCEHIISLNKILDILHEFNRYDYKIINNFFNHLSDPSRGEVNVISIGCAGQTEQQVYPWIYKIIQENPELKINIDLFDNFYYNHSCDNNGYPDVVKKDLNDWIMQPAKVKDDPLKVITFKHKIYAGLIINAYNTYFPTGFDEFRLIEHKNKLEQNFLNAVEKLLSANKNLIISMHIGDNYLSKFVIKMFNFVNMAKLINYQNLFVFAQNDRVFNNPAYVYNQTIIDLLENNQAKFLQTAVVNPAIFDEFKSNSLNTFESMNAESLTDLDIVAPNFFNLYTNIVSFKLECEQEQAIRSYLNQYTPKFKEAKMQELNFDLSNILKAKTKLML